LTQTVERANETIASLRGQIESMQQELLEAYDAKRTDDEEIV
jgi:hypothetical protein